MITIVSTYITYHEVGSPLFRCCQIIISHENNNYQLAIGGLPLEGDLQSILDLRYTELVGVAISRGNTRTNEEIRDLLYSASWTNEAFQAAVIENMAENVGGSMKRFADILELFEAINDEWPIQGEED